MDLQRDGARSTQFRFRQVGLALPNRQLIRTIGKVADCRVFWSCCCRRRRVLDREQPWPGARSASLQGGRPHLFGRWRQYRFLAATSAVLTRAMCRPMRRAHPSFAAGCFAPVAARDKPATVASRFWKWNAIPERWACVQSPPMTSFSVAQGRRSGGNFVFAIGRATNHSAGPCGDARMLSHQNRFQPA